MTSVSLSMMLVFEVFCVLFLLCFSSFYVLFASLDWSFLKDPSVCYNVYIEPTIVMVILVITKSLISHVYYTFLKIYINSMKGFVYIFNHKSIYNFQKLIFSSLKTCFRNRD
jgi:hypothetical protein